MFTNLKDEVEYFITQATVFENYDLLAFLENEGDEKFWKYIFQKSEPNKKIFFNSYSKEGHQGKSTILKYTDVLQKENRAVICIDSDFDYIIENNDIKYPFIFQTYTYSIENYYCCAKSLNNLCEKLSIKSQGFDFEIFLENYSKVIFELFILDIALNKEKTNINNFYTGEVKYSILENNGYEFLQELKQEVNKKILDLEKSFPIDSEVVNLIKDKLFKDKLLEDNFLHLYIKGHIVFKFIKDILEALKKKNIPKLKEKYEGNELKNKIIQLNKDIEEELISNFKDCYDKKYCLSFSKIKKNIKQFFISRSHLKI